MRRPGCSSASRDASPAAFPGGQKLVTDLEQDLTSVRQVELFAPYAGEAAQVMLDAIDAGGGERAATIRSLFQTRITGGIVGSFNQAERRPHPADHGLARAQELRAGRGDSSTAKPGLRCARLERVGRAV